MIFNTGAALLDAVVLSVVSREKDGTYGYKITQDVQAVISVSESTLYPVLRRLLKDGCLESYDQEFQGRNRRYYKITSTGVVQLNMYKQEWHEYTLKINNLFDGGYQNG
ncbi:PadR family transcriptional regulator [Candidatus Stoquefichus massiliensis]|uniref:PadR family transcriptional regulator n=1 Tax=Candidatus Stoquefichus massiliensis TaxID=1470350 RepID=UPI000487E6F1|nr:PadR family transcriptional regulator [Candidatus Stoquefichus massiliensis]